MISNRTLAKEITERKSIQQALQESERQLASLIDTLPGIVFSSVNDGQWSMTYLSEGCFALTGYRSEELVGHKPLNYNSITHPEDLPKIMQAIAAALACKMPYVLEYRITTKLGQEKWVWEKGNAILNEQGEVIGLEGFISDITELKQAQEQLLHTALHDGLTGLPNRALFMDRLSQTLKHYQQHPDQLFAILFLDLDRFKVINDSLGHAAGDQLLIGIGQRLSHCLRSNDVLARLGGDEFVILLGNIQDQSAAEICAQRIRRQLAEPFMLEGQKVFASISIGIAFGHPRYQEPGALLRDADIAMYQAKQQGRSCYQVFVPDMHTRAVALLNLERQLRQAFEWQEFRVYYQPIVCLDTRRIVGFEALIRWLHPQRGLLNPAEFLPIAQETGLMAAIDWWVLKEACQQMVQWQQDFASHLPLSMSVNMMGYLFNQKDIATRISTILSQTSLNPKLLKLEITESTITENLELVTLTLQQLRGLNIGLNIDDFGTGYSSLSRLSSFPIDALKIDRSFISKLDADPESLEIIKAIIILAHNLEIEVIAEGIETAEQLEKLQQLGCQYGQGYFFSPAVESEKVKQLLITAT